MRRVLVRLMFAAAGAVCLELFGSFATVAQAQTPVPPPGETPPPGMTPPTTPPGEPPPTAPPGETPPTTPPTTPPGETPPLPEADPFLAMLQALYEVIHEYVVAEFPDAPPEFQDWVTFVVFDHFFGDLLFEHLFGGAPGLAGGGGRP